MEFREAMIRKIWKSLEEMSFSAGDGSELSKMKSKVYRNGMFYGFQDEPVVADHGNLKLHKQTKGDSTKYALLDHNKEEAVYKSHFAHHKAGTRNIPFDHDEQVMVDKHKDSPISAWEHSYHHFEHSDHPLVTSDIQSDQGKKLWHKMSKKALDNGHHVYYHSESGKLIKLNHENLDKYVNKYHGDSFAHENRNLILSKKELNK